MNKRHTVRHARMRLARWYGEVIYTYEHSSTLPRSIRRAGACR